jgi:hypothetical protein
LDMLLRRFMRRILSNGLSLFAEPFMNSAIKRWFR